MNNNQFLELSRQAKNGETDAVMNAIEQDPSLVTRANQYGITLLHRAAEQGYLELCRALIKKGANVNQKNSYQDDTLIAACHTSNIELVKFIIDSGADLEHTNIEGTNALGVAAVWDNFEICSLLLSKGANLDKISYMRETSIYIYGRRSKITGQKKTYILETLLSIWRNGPHPSQVLRRKDEIWERRWPFMKVMVCCDFHPTFNRNKILLALNPPLPTYAIIPRLPNKTLQEYHAILRDKVFIHPGNWKIIVSFL